METLQHAYVYWLDILGRPGVRNSHEQLLDEVRQDGRSSACLPPGRDATWSRMQSEILRFRGISPSVCSGSEVSTRIPDGSFRLNRLSFVPLLIPYLGGSLASLSAGFSGFTIIRGFAFN